MKNGNNNSSNNTQSKSMQLTFEKKIMIYLSLIKFEKQQLMKCIHMKLNKILSNN